MRVIKSQVINSQLVDIRGVYFICGSFNDNVSSSEITASNRRNISEAPFVQCVVSERNHEDRQDN